MELASRQARLVLTARRQDRLDTLAAQVHDLGGEAFVVAGDITAPEVRERVVETASAALGGLDILINNAGVGGIGTFASAPSTRLRHLMEVNFFAAAELMRMSLPSLRASQDGLVVNVGSVLGHCAVPMKSEYCASKFALHGLNDALRMEFAKEGVDVLMISPSTTKSEFFQKAITSEGTAASNSAAMSSTRVASYIVRAMIRRRREVILSPGGKLLVWADRLCPSLLSRLLMRWG